MLRLKFVVFALVALGLWGYHLTLIGPLALAGSVEQAQASVTGAAAPIAQLFEARRSLTQAVALNVGTTPAASWNAGPKTPGKAEAPNAERFNAVRTAAAEVVPPELGDSVFVALTNEAGVLQAIGSAEPAPTAPEGLDLAAVSAAGKGSVAAIDGKAFLLFAVPQAISDKNEVRQAGSIVVGLPLLPEAKALEATLAAFHLSTLAVLENGKAVLQAGDASAVAALAALKGVAPVASGPVREFASLQLPLLVPAPTLSVGLHQKLDGTPYELVAAASSSAGAVALANYQVFGFGALAGLLLLAIVFTLLMSAPAEEGAAMSIPPPLPLPRRELSGNNPAHVPSAPAAEPEPAPIGAEASPDDFDFPLSTASMAPQSLPAPGTTEAPAYPAAATGAAPAYEPEPTSDPFDAPGLAAPPAPARPPPPVSVTAEQSAFQPAGGPLNDDDEAQRTVAYPVGKLPVAPPPVADPFALAGAQEPEPAPGSGFDENPDATRVAAVPAELIKAARAEAGGTTGQRPALKASPMPKVAAVAPVDDEEQHFRDTFRDFVATREKCGEPADGLPYEKFRAKLVKDKEARMAKYNARTVRFQVYVKDGKAALKAVPVKD